MSISDRISAASPETKSKWKTALFAIGFTMLGNVAGKVGDWIGDSSVEKAKELAGAVVTKTQLDGAVEAINGATAQQIEGLRTDLKILRTDIDRANQNCGLLTARVTGLHVALYVSLDPKKWKATKKSMEDAQTLSGDKALKLGPLDGQDAALKTFDVPRWR